MSIHRLYRDTAVMNTPAYEVRIWSYAHAPDDYKALFKAPVTDHRMFIVWERRVVSKGVIEWIVPNGVWWNLFYHEHERVIDGETTVYLLIEMVK